MARIFITGSADGLGLLAAKELVNLGHRVVLHARNEERAKQALDNVPGAETVLTADLSSIDETKDLAKNINTTGKFDAIVHNAGVYRVPSNSVTADGLPLIFAVNTLAPYILTCLIERPKRLIYLSSGMHRQGDANIKGADDHISYSDTKLHNVMLAVAIAHKWKDVYANAVDPGWVPTKMGGAGAPDNLEKGFETQVWLAVSDVAAAQVSGRYFYHKKQQPYLQIAADIKVHNKLISLCAHVTGVPFI